MEIRYQRCGLCDRIILAHGNKVVISGIQKRADIFGAAAEGVIGGNSQHYRAASSQVALDG